MISVVIPTIGGREDLLERTKTAFRESADVELVIVRNRSTCGEAWNVGAELATGAFLTLAADDLVPEPGWAESGAQAAAEGVYPAPWIKRADGSTENCGTLGQGLYLDPERDGTPCYNAPIPFMDRTVWDAIGPTLPIHYYADDYLAYRARFIGGLSVETRREYCFTHLDGRPGKARNVNKGQEYRRVFAEAVNTMEGAMCES